MNVNASDKVSLLNPCPLKDINYQIDPYIGCGHFCYYCYALNKAETDWKKEILIHKDITRPLKKQLKTISPQTIYIGWQTDPYQPCEAEYQQTRKVLKLFQEKRFSASILTKSDLVLRDTALLQTMSDTNVSISVAFNDNDVRRLFEYNTIDTEDRINALEKLKTAGVRTSALICPVIPYITDVIPLINMLAPHTAKIWIYRLSILDRTEQNWQYIENILESHFSGLKEQIETAVFSKDHPYWINLRDDLIRLQKDKDLNLSIHL